MKIELQIRNINLLFARLIDVRFEAVHNNLHCKYKCESDTGSRLQSKTGRVMYAIMTLYKQTNQC